MSKMNQEAIAKKWQDTLKLAQSYEKSKEKFTAYKTLEQTDISYLDASEGTIIRGEAVIASCKASELIQVLITTDMSTRVKFDPKTKSIVELEKYTDDNGAWSIRHYVVVSPSMMVSARDFLYVEHQCQEGKTFYLLTTSIEDDWYKPTQALPSAGSTVRGTNVFTYFALTELDNGDLSATFLAQANPNGWIPTAVANQVVYDRPLIVPSSAKIIGKSLKK